MDVRALLERVGAGVDAGRAFGPAIERGDATVVPVALVIAAGGGGGDEGPRGDSTGTSGGMGHFSLTWPLGAYVIRGDGARWVPAVDATRIVLAGLAVAKLIALRRRQDR